MTAPEKDNGPPSSVQLFGRPLEEAAWLERVRAAEEPLRLGDLGAYELVEEVSRGGQGVVLRARHRVTGEGVALKRLRAGAFASEATRKRLEREARAIAALEHPGIVAARELLEIDGQPVLVLDWVDGVPIAEWAAATAALPDGQRRRLETFVELARAVAHAHERGLLHRDLKSSNVLVDDAGRPRVLDFGLARHLEGEEARVTRTSEFVGTPVYAAPEQLAGGAEPDARADVYALGVILYEMLTGRLPHDVRGGPEAVLATLRRRDPIPPSQVDPSLPRALDAVVASALEPEPRLRTASAEELAADVQAVLDGRATAARPPSTWRRARRFAGRHRGPLVATLAAFAVLALFATDRALRASTLRRDRDALAEARAAEADARAEAERQLGVAREESRRAAIDRRRAQAMLDLFAREILLGVDPTDERARDTAASAVGIAAARIEQDFAEDPATLATLHLTLARVEQQWDRLPSALEHAERALALVDGDDPALAPRRVTALRALGGVLHDLARYAEADEAFARAVELAESLPADRREQELSAILSDRVGTLWQLDRRDEARELARRAADAERAYAAEHASYSVAARLNLAIVLAESGALDVAEPLFREILARGVPRAEESVLVARAHRGLGVLLRARGDAAGARAELESALAEARVRVGEGSLDHADAQAELARLELAEGNREDALELLARAVDLEAALLPEAHPTLVEDRLLLGGELRAARRHAEARPPLEAGLAGATTLYGEDDLELLPFLRELARLELETGHVSAARELLQRSLELAERNGRDDVVAVLRAAQEQIAGLEDR